MPEGRRGHWGGERSGNGSDGGDVGLLGDGVGVWGGAPWGFGLGPHGGGNGEGDGGGGGFTLADRCWSCVCRFAGRDLTRGSTPGTEAGDCWDSRHAGGGLTGSWAAGSNDSEGADCWEGGCLCIFAGGASRACWAQLACEGGMRGRRGRNWAPQIGRKSLHSRRSMLAPQSLNPNICGRASRSGWMGEAKRRSTQYSVLVTQYTQYSVVGTQYSILRSIV